MPNTAPEVRPLHVAVGVVADPVGNILIARRAAHLHQGGLWEFPGGKVEAGESALEALGRELWEELAIEVSQAEPLIKVEHDYGDKQVLLDVWWVSAFRGEPVSSDGEPIAWVAAAVLGSYAFPAANAPIVIAVQQQAALFAASPSDA